MREQNRPTDSSAPGPFPVPRSADTVARLTGRWVTLRPITPGDYEFLHRMTVDARTIVRWRPRGTTPSPEQFPQFLWQNVLAQFLVEQTDERIPVGTVTAYNADPRNSVVYLAVAITPEFEKSGWALEAVVIFIEYLFRVWNLRKVYIEAVEFNFAEYASGIGRFFQLEGCLRDHEYFEGQYWHVYISALYRENWPETARRLGHVSSLKI